MNRDKSSPRQIKRKRTSVFILTKDDVDWERNKEWRHFVWWSSRGNAIELMTRDYWALPDSRRGLICGPHFTLHEVTTLGDYIEFYGEPPIFYTYTHTYIFASTLNFWRTNHFLDYLELYIIYNIQVMHWKHWQVFRRHYVLLTSSLIPIALISK